MSRPIPTTHVGSLPRSQAVTDAVFGKEHGQITEWSAYAATIASAVEDVVAAQRGAGVDIPSDGEMSKISYATYIKDRLTGFAGDSPRRTPKDLEEYPAFAQRAASSGGTPSYSRPRCTGPVAVKDLQPVHDDIDTFKRALSAQGYADGFINAASPGVIALFQPNDYYSDDDAYLEALATAMASEYRAIVQAGLMLQLDCPDLALGRHMLYKGQDEASFLKRAERHVEALNAALDGLPAERIRLHICWGNYEGPHHHDIALEKVLPVAYRAHVGTYLIEGANPRHGHEWRVFEDLPLPEDKAIAPGVVDTTTNFIEHPDLIAERLVRAAHLVGADRLQAGTDCGFSTFAGFGNVDPEIAYAKLSSLAEGTRRANARLGLG